MSLQVFLHPQAEDELISIYLSSPHKGVISEAWNDLEGFVKYVPESQGKALDFSTVADDLGKAILSRLHSMNAFGVSLWIMTRNPIQAIYSIHRDDRCVRIWYIRRMHVD